MMRATLHADIAAARAAIAAHTAIIEERKSAAITARDELRAAIAAQKTIEQASAILHALTDAARSDVKARVESIASGAMSAVFGSGVCFAFDVSITKAGARMVPKIGYQQGSATLWRGVGDVGGGVLDVLSFALRLAVLLAIPDAPRVLVLDEPFRHVSNDRLASVAAMLRALADQTDVQFIIVSHEPEIAACADRHFVVTRSAAGTSTITAGGAV